MAYRRVLADSSLFIEYLRSHEKSATQLFRLERAANIETCAIAAAEIYYGARKPKAESDASLLLDSYRVHPFTAEMAVRTSRRVQKLVKTNKLQDLRDVMIAATALELGLPIATLNRAHFAAIPGLTLETLTKP